MLRTRKSRVRPRECDLLECSSLGLPGHITLCLAIELPWEEVMHLGSGPIVRHAVRCHASRKYIAPGVIIPFPES